MAATYQHHTVAFLASFAQNVDIRFSSPWCRFLERLCMGYSWPPALDSSQVHAAEGNENGKWMLVFYLLALIEPRKGCRSHSSCWPICSIADYICSCHYVVKSSFWSCSKNGAYLHIKFVLDCAA